MILIIIIVFIEKKKEEKFIDLDKSGRILINEVRIK